MFLAPPRTYRSNRPNSNQFILGRMEVAGLAIGVIELAGQLTKASIECYSIFSEIGEVGYSQDSMLHEVQTEALRLRQWEQG